MISSNALSEKTTKMEEHFGNFVRSSVTKKPLSDTLSEKEVLITTPLSGKMEQSDLNPWH